MIEYLAECMTLFVKSAIGFFLWCIVLSVWMGIIALIREICSQRKMREEQLRARDKRIKEEKEKKEKEKVSEADNINIEGMTDKNKTIH